MMMTEVEALDITRDAVWMILVGAGPAVAAAMVVGLIVALFQALTQVQEMTLTFVPKIVAVLTVMLFTLPFIGGQFGIFTSSIFSKIESGFHD